MDAQEAQKKAEELVHLQIKYNELKSQIKTIKAELKEHLEIYNINDITWSADNGYVEVITNTKYKLTDIPVDFKVPSEIAAIDTAEKAFKVKVNLTKEGKKMFREQDPNITNLMIPSIKKDIKVVV